MRKRLLGKTDLQVSEIGLGCEHLQDQTLKTIDAVIGRALELDINFLDVFMSQPQVRTDIGKAIRGKRQQVILQAHIGSVWLDGQYARNRNKEICQVFFEDYLDRFETDYLDIGMLHFSDTPEDLNQLIDNGILDYACELKRKGMIRAVGISSHDPLTAKLAVETGKIDVLMFSLNPAFDILPASIMIDDLFKKETFTKQGATGFHPARVSLYQTCEAMGTAITVMKGYASGMLLSSGRSPFGFALTPEQCIHYALTRPSVASILVGCRSPEEVDAAVRYNNASDEEKDFAPLLRNSNSFTVDGQCMYCNHCLPCPARIDIAQTIKYLDLASMMKDNLNHVSQGASIREHYQALSAHASDCVQCGDCETRCPFGVQVIDKMKLAASYFGL